MHLAATNEEDFVDILFALPDCFYINLATQDTNGNTALHIAAQYSQSSIVTQLVRHGAPTNIPNNHGLLPLHIAIIQMNIVKSYYLLKDKIIYNAQDNAGYTALHLAILFHDDDNFPLQDIIRHLRKHTNQKLKDRWGYTAYKLAKKFNKQKLFVTTKEKSTTTLAT